MMEGARWWYKITLIYSKQGDITVSAVLYGRSPKCSFPFGIAGGPNCDPDRDGKRVNSCLNCASIVVDVEGRKKTRHTSFV